MSGLGVRTRMSGKRLIVDGPDRACACFFQPVAIDLGLCRLFDGGDMGALGSRAGAHVHSGSEC